MIALVAGVGGGVLDQLVPERRLVGPHGVVVLFGEVDSKVVWGVGAGDADHTSVVHLLGHAFSHLYGVNLPAECPAESPLDEGLHALLYMLQETQKLTLRPRPEILHYTIYYSREP